MSINQPSHLEGRMEPLGINSQVLSSAAHTLAEKDLMFAGNLNPRQRQGAW